VIRPEAGSRWRVLVHDQDSDHPGRYLTAHHVQPDPAPDMPGEWSTYHVLPGTVFDELVAGSWLHVEEMGQADGDPGASTWWLNVAGATLWVDVAADGRPTSLTFYAPGEYADPVPGCTYRDGTGG
jgi:hypothetical protein